MATAVRAQITFTNTILYGDCIEVMQEMQPESVDFILTDPLYLVNYRDRTGCTIQNDINNQWLKPVMKEAYRLLKQHRLAVVYYEWTSVDRFFAAWREAGFQSVGHLVFRKDYASKSRLVRHQHDQAYLLGV